MIFSPPWPSDLSGSFPPQQVVTSKSKVRSFAFAPAVAVRAAKRAGAKGTGRSGARDCLARLALSLANNTVELLDLLAPVGAAEAEGGLSPGEVRAGSPSGP